MKIEIGTSEGLMSLSFHELWARMLIQFSDQYALVLRLVVITLLIPVDTSECERIFSLMNDIKTPERSSMGQQNLKEPDAVACARGEAGRRQVQAHGLQGRPSDGDPQGVSRHGRTKRAQGPPCSPESLVRI
jgi:hypothetical protein